ncbi:MAG: histidine--tRNA ligase [Acidimicrobiales bacterium]|nr:histidine--tRNA ligase [Acidimicrobiales bacterium]HRW37524.1 histidine--tRNA ligase [Aquihabitans sp.]
MARAKYQAPKGTQDVLPPASARWEQLLATYARTVELAGYGLLQSPMFEEIGVFQRESEGADAVRKEMYDFHDKGDRHVALRPEGTASVVRAFVQHQPPSPWKVWYATPAFRYENVQAGRLRQHHQVGLEVLGSADPDVDVEVITLGWEFLRALGLRRVELLLNTMGTAEDRRRYVEVLREFLRKRLDALAPDDRDKVEHHPMRVLDSKRTETRRATDDAPAIADHLSPESHAHFERVKEGLREVGIPFVLAPRLVRGFDYYTHTTFELVPSLVDNAQATILGGGRYDGLVEELGGPPTPGIGFGSGIERLLIACDAEGVLAGPASRVDVFVVDVTGGSAARAVTAELRAAGIRSDRAFDAKGMRAQMKAADRSGAAYAVIVGDQELADGTATVRPLREGFGDHQDAVARDALAAHLTDLLEKDPS